MFQELIDAIQRLNLSYPENFIGGHFQEIVALLSIVFGGSFLLFAWKHRAYFLGITGFLVGGWMGLFLKEHFAPDGDVGPFVYLGLCAVGGAYIAINLQRFVGMLLGGFTVALLLMVFFPGMLDPNKSSVLTLGMTFLLGGGLGAIFPKFFFVFNCSLIGAVFVTYGVSQAIITTVAGEVQPDVRTFIHMAVFLPLFLFGLIYQMSARDEEPVRVIAAHPGVAV